MKRIICLLVLCTCMCTMTFAQKKLTSAQSSLRSSIMSFLKAEGYQPTLDSDGDIKFKRQGDIYFVEVSDKDNSPLYVSLSKYFNYSDTFTKSKINIYALDINQYKMLKLKALDNSFVLTIQLYLTDSDAFTSIFGQLMKIIDWAEEDLKEYK